MENLNELASLPIDKQVAPPIDPNKTEVILPDVVDKATGQLSQGVDLPDQVSPLGSIHRKVVSLDPQATAEKIKLAQQLNEPEIFVDKNFDQLKKIDFNKNDAYWNKFQEDHPHSAEFLKNPANMAVTHDDIDNLAKHEQVVGDIAKASGYLDDIKAGFQSSAAGMATQKIFFPKSPNIVEGEDATVSHRLLSQAVGLALDLPVMTAGGIIGALGGGTAGLTAGAVAGTVVPGAGSIAAAGVAGVGGAAAGAGAGSFAAPAMLKSYLTQKFKDGDIQSISDFFKRPVNYGEVASEGLKQGAVGLATLGAGELAKPIAEAAGKFIPGLIGKGVQATIPLATEVGTMTVTGNAVEGKDTKAQDFLDGLLLVGAMHGSTALAEHSIETYRTHQAKNFYNALGDTAESSKLRERLPEKYKEQVATLTKDGPVENIYIPVKAMEEYFQTKGIDSVALGKELGIENELKEAQETGGDVKIPLASYVDKMVGTEHYKALADDVKFSPDARTPNEIKHLDLELKDQLTAADQVALKNAQTNETIKGESEQIRTNIYDQLIKTGMDKKTAETNAELFRKVAVVAAAKQEISPLEWFNKKPIEVRGENFVEQYDRKPIPEFKSDKVVGDEQIKKVISSMGLSESYQHPEAVSAIREQLSQFKDEITKAEAGKRSGAQIVNPQDGQGYTSNVNTSTKSTFPKWFGELGFSAKKDFLSAIEKGNSKKLEAIVSKAIDSLKNGHGEDVTTATKPNLDFVSLVDPESLSKSQAIHNDMSGATEAAQSKVYDQSRYHEEARRGSIQFRQEKTVITLMNSADKSTFVHEMGHLFFEDFYNHAMSGDASIKHMNDWKVLAEHVGYNPEQIGLTVDQHEKLARTFEAYLMDGKAPVQGLARVFNVFRRWMTNVYKSMSSLGVEISPEVRDVMDRMVATEDEIAVAKKRQGLDMKLDLTDVPDAVKEKLSDLEKLSEERAFAKLMKDQMREISADNKQFLVDKEKELTKKYTNEISKTDEGIKVLDLKDALKKKDIWSEADKFLKGEMSEEKSAHFEALAEDLGYTSGDHMAKDIKETPSIESMASARVQEEMKPFTSMTDKAVVREKAMQVIHNEKSVELLALQKEILLEKVNAESTKELNKIADAMEKDDTKLIHEWLVAKEVHKVTGKFNEKLEKQSARFEKELSRLEERATTLREKNKQRELATKWLDAKDEQERKHAASAFRESIAALKKEITRNSSDEAGRVSELAKEMLAKKTFKDARKFTSYFTGERNAALRVAKAVSENNWRGALEAKHEQMLNHALAKEAIRVGKKVDSQLKYLDKMRKLRLDLWKHEDHFYQAASILSRFGFERKDYDPKLKTESLNEWADKQAAKGNDVNIAPWIFDENIKLDQSTITTEQLTDIRNAIKNIQFIVNNENNQSLLDSKLTTEEVARALIVESMANVKPGERIKPKMEETKVDKMKSFARSYLFSLKRIESVVGALGGWRDDSKFMKVFVDSTYEAANKESDIRWKAAKELESNWSIYSKQERKDLFNKKKFIPEFQSSLSKDRLIAMALNIGNEDNRTKLFETRPVGMDNSLPWNETVGMQILQRELTEKDWRFVQSTWGHIDSFWPQIADLHRKMTGFTPGKVEAKGFTIETENGPLTLDGGYYPLKSDPRNSFQEELKNNADAPLYTEQVPSWKAATRTGHTKERTAAQYPISLDLGVINRHLNDVIHDLAFRQTVRDMSRIISRDEFQSEIKSTSGAEGYKAFKEHLAAIAGNKGGEPATAIDRVLKAMRLNTTTATLFLKLGVAAKHIPNMLMAPNAVEGFGYKDTLEAYAKYGTLKYAMDGLTGDTVETRKMIHEKSAFMRDLYDSPEYSIERTHNKFSKNDESDLAHFAHGMITKANAFVTEPIWMGGYNKAIAEGKSEAEAIKQGDLLAKRVMGSSRKYDVAPIMRGTEIQKMFAMFFGPINNIHNRWMRENGIFQRDKDVSRALGFLTMSIGMQVMGSALMLKTPNWDDDKEVKEWIFGNTAELPLEFFPGFRDVADQVAKRSLGLQAFGYMPSPAFSGIEYGLKGVDAVRGLATGKSKPMDAAEKISKAASFNLGYPDFFNQAFFNLYDYSNGMKPELKDIYRRRSKKERLH